MGSHKKELENQCKEGISLKQVEFKARNTEQESRKRLWKDSEGVKENLKRKHAPSLTVLCLISACFFSVADMSPTVRCCCCLDVCSAGCERNDTC